MYIEYGSYSTVTICTFVCTSTSLVLFKNEHILPYGEKNE